MKLDLSELVNTPGMSGSVDIDEPCPKEMEIECTAPVKGQIKVENTGTLLLISGEVETKIKFECSRCLVDFTESVDAEIEEEFRVERVGDMMRALPLDEEDIESAKLVENNLLDIDELIRQTLLVTLPIAPLCRPECQGLCTTCGENLNVRKCTCPLAEPESPWHVLAELMEEKKKEE